MRNLSFLLILFVFVGCKPEIASNPKDFSKILQDKIDSLELELSKKYPRVSYGGTMGMIQSHHSKLWFAGMAENWDLADFYHHETEEHLELLEEYRADKDATKNIKMIKPFLEKVDQAIADRNLENFESSYRAMTNTCTQCHQISGHPELVIQVPTKNPYSNQTFKKKD